MRHRIAIVSLYALALASVTLAATPELAFARAGGGGGRGGGGSLIALPILIVYSLAVSWLVASKNRQCKDLTARLEAFDPMWNMDAISARVEETYFKVQEAWAARDQDIAKDYMSPRLYAKHKAQTDQMIREGRRNVLENVNLKQAKVIGVRDLRDDAKDRFWVHLKGSMVDYTVNDTTGGVVAGSMGKAENFTEIWSFVRGEKGWVLDEIDQEAGLTDIGSVQCFTDHYGPSQDTTA
jgi:predicted lipid-binding transport protein (Tim44 family)